MYVDNYETIIKAFDADVKQSFFIKESDPKLLIFLDLLFSQKDYMIVNLATNPDYQDKIDAIDALILQIQDNCLDTIEPDDNTVNTTVEDNNTCEYPTILGTPDVYAWANPFEKPEYTLDEVTTAGNTTENSIEVGGLNTNGNVIAAKHITLGGTKDDFVKGDGSLSNHIDGGQW